MCVHVCTSWASVGLTLGQLAHRKKLFFSALQEKSFLFESSRFDCEHLLVSRDCCPSPSSRTATVHARFVGVRPSNSPVCQSLHTSDCSVCATEPGRRLGFNPSIGTAKSATVLGLRVNAHQDKIPFVQKLKEGIQKGQLLTFFYKTNLNLCIQSQNTVKHGDRSIREAENCFYFLYSAGFNHLLSVKFHSESQCGAF